MRGIWKRAVAIPAAIAQIVAVLIIGASASAHHAYAMFDLGRTATVTGR